MKPHRYRHNNSSHSKRVLRSTKIMALSDPNMRKLADIVAERIDSEDHYTDTVFEQVFKVLFYERHLHTQ